MSATAAGREVEARPRRPRGSSASDVDPHARSRSCRRARDTTAASASVIAREPPRATGQPNAVAGADQRHADRRAHRPVERAERMRGHAAEQRARLRRLPSARRAPWPAAPPAARSAPAGAGGVGTCSTGRSDVLGQLVEARRAAAEQPPPAPRRPRRVPSPSRSSERSITPALPSSSGCAKSTSGQRHSSPWRSSSSDCEERRARRAIGCTAEQWSCSRPGQRQLARARAAADRRLGLEHRHLDARARERGGAGEPVRARSRRRSRRSRDGRGGGRVRSRR